MALAGALLLLLPGTTFVAQAEPVPPPGVTILLNGTPMSGEGGKIDSCVLSLDISGLEVGADPATAIGVTVNAVGPTVPEGTEATLVDDTSTTTEATWSGDYDMTTLVAPYEPKPNGYHLRVIVSINDVTAGEKTVWLGCGEPQTGTPSRLVFAVAWQGWDGAVLPGPPADLTIGWEGDFVLECPYFRAWVAQPDARTVVANYGGDLAKMLEEGPEVRLVPVFLEMADPPRRTYQRRALAVGRVGNSLTLSIASETDDNAGFHRILTSASC